MTCGAWARDGPGPRWRGRRRELVQLDGLAGRGSGGLCAGGRDVEQLVAGAPVAGAMCVIVWDSSGAVVRGATVLGGTGSGATGKPSWGPEAPKSTLIPSPTGGCAALDGEPCSAE
ncbi:hypothetical protein NKH18_15140 [Streptomyces sp. M10(2022)]